MEFNVKKFSAILICLLMIITCSLAGCATFSINKVKYYNEVLATVDETKITRFDLLSAYNSYGNSYYVQQMGQSEKKALSSTLNMLIDRELMYQYALDNDDLYKPTAYQVNSVIQEMFDSLDEQMESYVEKSKKILNIEIKEDENEDENEETAYLLEDYHYSKRAEVKYQVKERTVYYTDATYKTKSIEETEFAKTEQYNHYYIEYVEEVEEDFESLIDSSYLNNFTHKNTVSEINKKYFEHFLDELTLTEGENTTAIFNKARSLFAKDLTDYEYYLRDENGKAYDKSSENLFNRYFKRTFDSQIQSQYLENIRTHYLKNETLSIDLLVEEFNYLTTLNYNDYSDNHESYKNKMKDIGTKGDSVLYHPTTDTQFGYFIHTLISFDSIKDNLKLLDEIKDQDTYDVEYQKLIQSITVKARNLDTGLVDEDAVELTLTDIIEEYNDIQSLTTYDEKMSAFVNFMFKYTGDTATLSQGMPYVVGTNGYSSMVEEFNNEAIKLMTGKNPNGEQVIEAKIGNMSSASINDIDNLCITEYGIHFLFYVGDVDAFDIPYGDTSKVYIQNDNIDGEEQFNLYTKIINPLTKETYFDMMFDYVYPSSSDEVYTSNNGYTDYEKGLTELSKSTHKVTKYTTKIKATKTSL